MEAGAEIEDTQILEFMVLSRRTRPFPATAVHLFRQQEKERCLKAMALLRDLSLKWLL